MGAGSIRDKKGKSDKNKKNQAKREDVAFRRTGEESRRPKTKDNAPKAKKPGHQKGK